MIDKKAWKKVKKILKVLDKLPGYHSPTIEYQAFMMLSNNTKKDNQNESD